MSRRSGIRFAGSPSNNDTQQQDEEQSEHDDQAATHWDQRQGEFVRRRGLPVIRPRPALSDRLLMERNLPGTSKQAPLTANVPDRPPAPRFIERFEDDADPARAMSSLLEHRNLEAAVHDRMRRVPHLRTPHPFADRDAATAQRHAGVIQFTYQGRGATVRGPDLTLRSRTAAADERRFGCRYIALINCGIAWSRPALPNSRRPAQRLRRLAEGADEGASHPLGIAEAGGLRHAFDRLR